MQKQHQKGGSLNMTTLELNNRKYTLITEIMRIDSEAVIDKIEKLLNKEILNQKSPLSFSIDELKQEIAEAEKETVSHSQDEVKLMAWKK